MWKCCCCVWLVGASCGQASIVSTRSVKRLTAPAKHISVTTLSPSSGSHSSPVQTSADHGTLRPARDDADCFRTSARPGSSHLECQNTPLHRGNPAICSCSASAMDVDDHTPPSGCWQQRYAQHTYTHKYAQAGRRDIQVCARPQASRRL